MDDSHSSGYVTPSSSTSSRHHGNKSLRHHGNHDVAQTPVTSQPPKGALLLGRGEETYTTRYCIDHSAQSQGLCAEVMYEECVPCCHHTARSRVMKWVWSFLRSEAFIYFLHITSIVFGVAKEAVGVTREDPFLTIIHTGIETGATLLLLIIRMVGGRNKEKVVANAISDLEYVNQSQPDAHVRKVKVYINAHTVFSALLVLICVGSFVLFYLINELGWTLLSNNFCMITTNVVSGLLFTRVGLALVTIREDQFKVAIFESLALIEDLSNAAKFEQALTGGLDKQRGDDGDGADEGVVVSQLSSEERGRAGGGVMSEKEGFEMKSGGNGDLELDKLKEIENYANYLQHDNNNHNDNHHHLFNHNHSNANESSELDRVWVTNDISVIEQQTNVTSQANNSITMTSHGNNDVMFVKANQNNADDNNTETIPNDKGNTSNGKRKKKVDGKPYKTTDIKEGNNTTRRQKAQNGNTADKNKPSDAGQKKNGKKGSDKAGVSMPGRSKPVTSGQVLIGSAAHTMMMMASGAATAHLGVIGPGLRGPGLEEVEEKAERFLAAVEATPLFHQPTHIDVHGEERERVKTIRQLHKQKSETTNTKL